MKLQSKIQFNNILMPSVSDGMKCNG